jgi:hypothetical protein
VLAAGFTVAPWEATCAEAMQASATQLRISRGYLIPDLIPFLHAIQGQPKLETGEGFPSPEG